jgi:PAS domain S-box-containing protein
MKLKNWEKITGGRSGLIMICALAVLSLILILEHILNLGQLLVGTNKFNMIWGELIIDLVSIFSIGIISLSLVRTAESKRSKAEHILSYSEERYKDLFENSPLGIYRTTPDGQILLANSALIQMLGCSSFEDLAKRNLEKEGFEPNYPRSRFKEIMEKEGEVKGLESAWIKRDRTALFIRENAKAIRDENGKILYYEGTVEDVTERNKVELELEKSRQRYIDLFESAPDSIVTLDLKGFITSCNTAAVKLSGYSKEELVGKHFSKLGVLRLSDIPKYLKLLNSIIKGNIPEPLEVIYIHKNGNLNTVEAQFALLKEDGRTTGVQVIVRDITERKKAEEALRASEQKYKLLFEKNLAGVYHTTLDGKMLNCNESFARLLGYDSAEEVMTHRALEFYFKDAERKEFLALLQRRGNLNDFEICMRRRDGKPVWILENVTLIKDEKSGQVSIQGTSIDITGRKQAEQVQAVLFNIANATNTTKNIQELFQSIQRELGKLMDTTNFFIAFYDKETDTISLPYHVDEKDKFPSFIAGKTKTSYVIRKKEPTLITQEVREKLIQSGEIEIFGTPSKIWLGVPLKIGEEIVGVVTVQSYTDLNAYGERELEILKFVSGQIALAIERKKAEEELKKSAQLLRDTGEMAKVGGWELDLLTKEVLWTEEVGRIHGVEPGYKPMLEEALNFYAPESRPALELVLKKAAETGEPYDLESLFIPSGSKDKIWVRSLGRAVYSGGKIVKLTGTFQNIDKYKRVEEALRESETKLKDAQVLGRIGSWEFDVESQEIIWSDQTYKLYDRDLALGPPTTEEESTYYSQQQALKLREYARCAIEEGMDFKYDLEANLPSGRHVFYSAVMQPIKDTNGRVVKLFGTVQDITERKKVEEEIKNLAKFPSENPYPVFRISKNGTILYANDKSLSLLDEWGTFVNQNAPDYLKQSVTEVFNTGLTKNIEIEHQGRILSFIVVPICDAEYVNLYGRDITDRKQAEEKIKKSAREWEITFNSITDFVSIQDKDFKLLRVNKAYTDWFKCKSEELVGRKCYEIFHGTKEPWPTCPHKKTLETRKPVTEEFFDPRLQIHLEVSTSPILDEKGEVKGTIHIVKDVTERKRAEKALRESEERYRLLADNVSDVIWTMDLNFKFTYFSPSIKQLLGYTPEEIISKRPDEVLTPVSYELIKKVIAEEMEIEMKGEGNLLRSRTVEVEEVRKDGTTLWVEIKASFLRDADNKAIGILGITRDIDERKKAEEKISSLLRFQTEMLDTATIWIDTLDAEGNVTFWNHAAERISGYSKEEVLGHAKIWEWLYPDPNYKAQILTKAMEIIQKGERVENFETVIRRKEGEKKVISWQSNNLINDKGEIVGSIALGADITERKKTEDALKESEEKYRAIIEAVGRAGEGIIIIQDNEQGEAAFVFVNDQFCQMSDYSQEELMGRSPWDFVPHEVSVRLKDWYKRRHTGESLPGHYEAAGIRKDGAIVPLDLSIVTMPWQGNIATVLYLRDITERKKAEEALRESEEKHRTYVENAPDGIFIVDSEARYVDVNGAACRMTGYSRDELLNMTIMQLAPSDTPPEVFETFEKLKRNGKTSSEIVIQRKDGSVIHASLDAVALSDGQYMAFCSDVTGRKKAEERLRISEKFLNSVIENTPNPMWISDENGTVIRMNQALRDLLKISDDEIVGKYNVLKDTQVKEQGLLPLVTSVFEKGETVEFEIDYVTIREEQVQLSREVHKMLDIIISPVKDSQGKVVNAIAQHKDITERKRAEEERVQHTRNMEFLSEAAMGFVDVPAEKDIYRFIGEQLRELTNDVLYVLVNSFDQKTREIQVRALLADDQHIQAVLKTLGTDPKGMSFVVSEEAWNGLISGKLVRVPGGIYELSFGEIPKAACDALEKLAGIGDIFTMGFTKKGELYGSASIIMREGSQLSNRDVIETFVRQSGVALQRKLAEEALRSERDKLETMTQNMGAGMAIISRDYRTEWANKVLKQIFGEVEGKSCYSTYNQNPDICPECGVRKVFETGIAQVIHEQVGKDKEDNIIWSQIIATPIRDKEGNITAALEIVVPITERKQAEEALRESQAKLQSIFSAAPAGIGMTINQTFGELNTRLCEITGYTKEELSGKSIGVVYPSDQDYLSTRSEIYNQLREKGHSTIEASWKRKDGKLISVLLNCALLKPGDFSQGITFTVLDITEHKKAEEKIKQAAEEWEITFNSISDLVSIHDKEFRFLRLNQAYAKLFKINPEDSQGKPCYELIHGTKEPPPDCPHRETLKTRRSLTREFFESHLGIHLEVSISPLFNNEGEIVATVHIAKDITNRKKMEAQLIQTEKLAAVGTLAYGIAHEFNNILAGMLANAELGLITQDSRQIKECFKIIADNSHRAASITNNLLAFARQKEARKKLIDITEPLRSVLAVTRRDLEKLNIEIVEKFKPVPKIYCDAGQLSEVFLNMVTNARDAMRKKGGVLTIQVETARDNIRIIFKDTGCGIPEELKGKIFEPFVTTKGALGGSEVPGTGLGLFLTYGIINGYQGKIEVESKVGKGTQFIISIPVSKNLPPQPVQEIKNEPFGEIERKLKILLVDDEETIVSGLKKFLESRGHQVTSSLRGKEGLRLFKKDKFDLVLSDITMPDMDGIELIKKIKEQDQKIKIIVITGHIMQVKENEAWKAGADEFLIKPFKNEVLCLAISKLMTEI